MSSGADRVNDPGEHFPYKRATVVALLEADAPAGPEGPDDKRARVSDYTSRRIADASDAYVRAQATVLQGGDEPALAAYRAARDDLVAARAEHRANRDGVVVVAKRAG